MVSGSTSRCQGAFLHKAASRHPNAPLNVAWADREVPLMLILNEGTIRLAKSLGGCGRYLNRGMPRPDAVEQEVNALPTGSLI